MLPVTITSNCFGARTSCIAALSTYMWSSSTSGYSACTSVTTSRQNWKVSSTLALSTLVSLLAALARRLERDVGDALDLRARVAHRVEGLVGAGERAVGRRATAARLAEVDVAGELADDQDVEAGDHLGLQARGVRSSSRVADRRAEVGEQAERPCAGRGSPARAAARARACRTSSRRPRRTAPRRLPCASVERRFGQRMAVRLVGGAADQRRLGLERAGRARSARARPAATISVPMPSPGRIAIFMRQLLGHASVRRVARATACVSSRSASKARILSAWRSVRPMSSKPLSRQYLRNGSTSNVQLACRRA